MTNDGITPTPKQWREEMSAKHTPSDGDLLIVTSRYTQHECETCGEPATKKHTFLLHGARGNPRSKAYGRDDCSWCSDADVFTCDEHKPIRPYGMGECGTYTKGKGIEHMFFHWHETDRKIAAVADCDCGAAASGKWKYIHAPTCAAIVPKSSEAKP